MKNTHIDKLREQKLKLTPKRQAILNCFIQEGRYLTPEQVWDNLKKDFKSLGLPSIYRNLDSFESCGILVRIQREDRRLYYALRDNRAVTDPKHHHHHIVCVKCGKVDELEACAINDAKKIKGYKVVDHFVQVNGVCSNCSNG